MKKTGLFLLLTTIASGLFAQNNSDTIDYSVNVKPTIIKDERIDILGTKMAEYNESLANKIQMVNGYRLMLLNTTDRAQALQVRSLLLQQYPDQKVYMAFLSPYIKLKIGNFLEKSEAEKFRKQLLAAKIVTGNIYLLPEKVEQKPEKAIQTEE
jgi:hypothetical protein